jgi:hypothetical protein
MKPVIPLALVLSLLLSISCGKKGPPLPALKSQPVKVLDLKAERKSGAGVWLTWGTEQASEELSGFLILRGEEKKGASACRACPDFYSTIADLEISQAAVNEKKDRFAFLDENVQKDYRYYYEIQPKYANGSLGRGVVIDIGVEE